jgi:hypothetical protein
MTLHHGFYVVAGAVGVVTKCYTNSDAALSLERGRAKELHTRLCPGMSHWTLYGLTTHSSRKQTTTTNYTTYSSFDVVTYSHDVVETSQVPCSQIRIKSPTK